ncbi:MAG: hypothetical protein IKK33_02855 [Lachnospiraceae bacterium]|nr:hypothetical protein [Lachnospiraceae bacterium]
MEKELTQPAQLCVTRQDMERINHIFASTGVSLPISLDGNQESWQVPVTEEFLQGITAQRKRLRSRNLQIHRQSLDWAQQSPRFGGGIFAQGGQMYIDGEYKIGCLRKHWKRITTYMRNQRKVSSFNNTSWLHYYLIKESGEECRISSIDTINLVELYGRSDEYRIINGKYPGRALQITTIFLSIVGWLLSAVQVPLWLIILLIPSIRSYAPIVLGCLVWCVVFSVTGTWLASKFKLWRKWRIDSHRVITAIREKVADFCIEKFISIVCSRVQRLYYADAVTEVGDIISCDISGFLRNHANVVNCETLNFWFTGFREDGNYMYMDVTLRVRLDRDLGGRIERKKQTIMLQLMKPIQGIMSEDLYHDWSVVKIETHEK